MTKKILVAYASRSGSTMEAADKIAEELSSQGDIAAEVISVKKAKDIASYDAIVLGSAIWMGRPLSEMISFIKSYKPILSTKKVAFFGLCMTLKEATPENIKTVESFFDPIKALITPVAMRLFAGRIDPSKGGFFARLIIKMTKAPIGDFRDWVAIRSWTKELKSKFDL